MKRILLGLIALLALVVAGRAQQPLTYQITGPAGSVPLVTSSTGSNSQIAISLSGVSGQWTYLCGFVISSAGTSSAATGAVTITGGPATMNFVYNFVSSGQGVLGAALGPGCITSATQGGTFTITVPAGGSGTSSAVTIWGYRL